MGAVRQFGNGDRDFRGQTVNNIKIGEYFPGTRPRRWAATCTACGVSGQSFNQDELVTGAVRCRNSGCGFEHMSVAAGDTLARYKRRELEAEAARKQLKSEQQATAVEEAKTQFAETNRKLGIEMRKQILNLPDAELKRDSKSDAMRLTSEESQRYNREQLSIFRAERPDAYLSDGNIDALGAYFQRNGIRLVNSQVLAAAYDRLADFGLLEARPEPARVEQPEAIPALEVEPITREPEPEGYPGFDEETGQPRVYTEFEVSRMTGEQFRRLCMKKADTTFTYRALY